MQRSDRGLGVYTGRALAGVEFIPAKGGKGVGVRLVRG
jgi:hypothetical protein